VTAEAEALTLGKVRGWGLGLLRLSRRDFYEMRLGEFWEAMQAYWEEQTADRRHLGELARGLGVRIANLFVKKPMRKASKFWEMPWDGDGLEAARAMEALPIEERARMAKEFLQRIDKVDDHGGEPEN